MIQRSTLQTGPDCPTHPAVRHLNAEANRPLYIYCESMTTTTRTVSKRKGGSREAQKDFHIELGCLHSTYGIGDNFFREVDLPQLPTHTNGTDQSVGINWRNCLMDKVYTSR